MNLVRFGLVVVVQLRLEEREGEIIVGGLISLRVPVSCARNSYFQTLYLSTTVFVTLI